KAELIRVPLEVGRWELTCPYSELLHRLFGLPRCRRLHEPAVAMRGSSLHRVTVLTGSRRLTHGALEEPFDARAPALPISQWHQADAEYCPARKVVDRDPFTRARGRTAHLDQPGRRLAGGVAHQCVALLIEWHERDLEVGRVGVDAFHHAGEHVLDRLIVHREGMVRCGRCR